MSLLASWPRREIQDRPMEDRDETYDPFEALDRAAGAGAVRDPYPTFATLRGECPVHHGRLSAAFGLPEAFEAVIVPTDRHFVAMSHEAAVQVLRDGETFSSRGYAGSIGLVLGHSILEMDDPEHARYRELIQQAFTLQAMERWEARLVRPIVHGLVDRFVNRGRADLVRELTFPFPIHVIAGMLGLPEADLPRFHRWAVELINIAGDIDPIFASFGAQHPYPNELIDQTAPILRIGVSKPVLFWKRLQDRVKICGCDAPLTCRSDDPPGRRRSCRIRLSRPILGSRDKQ